MIIKAGAADNAATEKLNLAQFLKDEQEIVVPTKEQSVANSNQASIVLEISYEENSLLLTGDCEVEVLEGLVEKKNQIDIVKAPHHGTLNSYRELGVKEVVFSVGENSYGHPAQAIIDDLIVEGISYH